MSSEIGAHGHTPEEVENSYKKYKKKHYKNRKIKKTAIRNKNTTWGNDKLKFKSSQQLRNGEALL